MVESESVLATTQRQGDHRAGAGMSKERFLERQRQVRDAANRPG